MPALSGVGKDRRPATRQLPGPGNQPGLVFFVRDKEYIITYVLQNQIGKRALAMAPQPASALGVDNESR
jgi:hypothetical protein